MFINPKKKNSHNNNVAYIFLVGLILKMFNSINKKIIKDYVFLIYL